MTRAARRRSTIAGLADCDPELEARLRQGMDSAEALLWASLTEGPAGGSSAGHGLPETRLAETGLAETGLAAPGMAAQLVLGGGKRLRPLLVLLGAEFGRFDRPGVAEAAVLVELVHTASLCHDDVMDQATTRRGVPSLNAVHGNAAAVRTGNWLMARAGSLVSRLAPECLRLHAEVAELLVRGQVLELAGPAEGADPIGHYLAVVSGKSASLISMSLRIGALQSGAPQPIAEALAEYGEQLGIAFQISDDLLDVTSHAAVSGKEQGKDLAAGVLSLPVLLALAEQGPRGRRLRRLLSLDRPATARERRRMLALLQVSPAMGTARAMMQERLGRARRALDGLPAGPARSVLDGLCTFVAERDH